MVSKIEKDLSEDNTDYISNLVERMSKSIKCIDDILIKALEPFGINEDNIVELIEQHRLEPLVTCTKAGECTLYTIYLDGKKIVNAEFRSTVIKTDDNYSVEIGYNITYPNGKPGEGDNNE